MLGCVTWHRGTSCRGDTHGIVLVIDEGVRGVIHGCNKATGGSTYLELCRLHRRLMKLGCARLHESTVLTRTMGGNGFSNISGGDAAPIPDSAHRTGRQEGQSHSPIRKCSRSPTRLSLVPDWDGTPSKVRLCKLIDGPTPLPSPTYDKPPVSSP